MTEKRLDKFAIAAALREIGTLLRLEGGNPFRARAYENGADALESVPEKELPLRIEQGRLTEVSGIGDALAAQVAEIFATGTSKMLERLREKLPAGVVELAQVPGLGLKKAQLLHEVLRIASIDELEDAASAGRLREVKGFGAKTEQKILEGVRAYRARPDRVLLVDAEELADDIAAYVRRAPDAAGVSEVNVAGSIRRWEETTGEIAIVASVREAQGAKAALDHFEALPQLARVETRSAKDATARMSSGVRVSLHVASPAELALALHHFTGSPAHVAKLADVARSRGLVLAARTLHDVKSRRPLVIADERDLYAALDMQFVPPELREDTGEIEAALAGTLGGDLVELGDIQGMVHCHTVFSDGRDTVEAMARKAEAMGMKYLTITDHSPAAHYAGGVTLDRLKEQWDEIARVQELVRVKILRGTESDILEDGALDYPDGVLEKLDVVIASVHSRMKMEERDMTKRLVRAMKLPVFKIWGHALGRLIMRREPFACRVEEVLDAIAVSRAAIEVNGDPYRLDMEPRWLRAARERGISFVVSVDAHSTRGMENLRYGVHTARRGGVQKSEVLNTLPSAAFARAVKPAA